MVIKRSSFAENLALAHACVCPAPVTNEAWRRKKNSKERTEKVRIILSDYKIPALIITSLIFGLVHINNYVETFVIDIALFMLIVPRIISGAMMAWVKLKNKHLGWSIALHALNNGVVIVLMIF